MVGMSEQEKRKFCGELGSALGALLLLLNSCGVIHLSF